MEALRLTPLDPLVIALRFAAALGLGVLLLPGQRGLYLAGAIAGLTDVDAITLSMAELARAEGANPGSASLTIVIAVASNTLFKAGVVTFLGERGLRRIIVPAAGAIILAGAFSAAWLR